MTLGLVDEDEPKSEPATRESWQTKASKKTLTDTDDLLKLIKEVQPKAALNYTKYYVNYAVRRNSDSTCSIRVSTSVFERLQRIERSIKLLNYLESTL